MFARAPHQRARSACFPERVRMMMFAARARVVVCKYWLCACLITEQCHGAKSGQRQGSPAPQPPLPIRDCKYVDIYREKPIRVIVKVLVPVREHPKVNSTEQLAILFATCLALNKHTSPQKIRLELRMGQVCHVYTFKTKLAQRICARQKLINIEVFI